MAYSRWSNCVFYTYWTVYLRGPRLAEDRDNATFAVCGLVDWAASDLREDLDGCVKETCRLYEEQTGKPAPDHDKNVLRQCMQEFLQDVDTEYPTKKTD